MNFTDIILELGFTWTASILSFVLLSVFTVIIYRANLYLSFLKWKFKRRILKNQLNGRHITIRNPNINREMYFINK